MSGAPGFSRRAMLGIGASATLAALPGTAWAAAVRARRCDRIIRGGTIYDGSGASAYRADIAVVGDRIAAIGTLNGWEAAQTIDAGGLAVSPGFVDTISYSWETFPYDARATSNLYQGVTFEIFGEGDGAFPLNAAMRAEADALPTNYPFRHDWSSYGEFMAALEKRGVGVNFAAPVPATTVRRYVIGDDDRAPTADELAQMQELVRGAMREGAIGLTTGTSWTPGSFAKTDEIVALVEAAGEFGGIFASSVRSQGEQVVESFDEIVDICRRTRVRTELGNIKQAGRANWGKADACIDRIRAARAEGLPVSASMYPYTGMWTTLATALPPWAHDGGFDALVARARDPQHKARMVREMRGWTGGWEQLLAMSGSPDNVMLLKVDGPVTAYQGKTLAAVMALRGDPSPESVAIDILAESGLPVSGIFHAVSEDNLRKLIVQPWISFGSDSPSYVLGSDLAKDLAHPRAYGMVARVIGHYARDLGLMPLEEAVRRLSWLPMRNFNIADRGALAPGYFADIAVFDPAAVRDLATYDDPRRYATGMHHVLVNGTAVLSDGRRTAALPGRHVRRAGWSAT